MWITLILMIVSFLLTKSSTGDSKKALLTSAVVGAGAGLVTSQTEWGSELNSNFNNFVGLDDSWTGFSGDGTSTDAPTSGNSVSGVGSSGGSTNGVSASSGKGPGGLFSSLPTWLGGAAVAGAGAAATTWSLKKVPAWVWWTAGGLGIYWLFFKD